MILGVGTVALDSLETPAGTARDVPGGSAPYFAAAATTRVPVAVVGVTGEDFPEGPLARLAARGVDVRGIVRESPSVPTFLRNPDFLFLGSTDPGVQVRVLEQAGSPGTVLLDTMPHWVRGSRPVLDAILPRVDVILLNEDEVHVLGGEALDEGTAAEGIRHMGPTWVVVKRGARGACACGPAGLVAVLAEHGGVSPAAMEEGLGHGALMGARAVSAFGFEALVSGAAG